MVSHPNFSTKLRWKDIFQNYPKLNLDQPFSDLQQKSELAEQFPEHYHFLKDLQTGLLENHFLQDDEHVTVVKHIPYMPAIIHDHSFFEMIYVEQGSCLNSIENQAFHLQAGDFFIIAPETKHAISGFSDDLILYNFLIRKSTFDSTFFNLFDEKDVLSDFFAKSLYDPQHKTPFIYFQPQNPKDVAQLVHEMVTECAKKDRYSQRLLLVLVNAIFINLLRDYEAKFFIHSHKNLDFMTLSILDDIYKDYHSITLGQLAEKYSYSERHLSRLIKQHTQQTFRQLVLSLRLKNAERLLVNTPLPIQDIAGLVGFSDLSNFYHYFSKTYGQTPLQVRKASLKP